MNFTHEAAQQLLRNADVLYADDEEQLELNMNDVWGWAVAWGVIIPPENVVEVAQLFWRYGWCGLVYWVSEQNEQMRSEFEDINRMVGFARHEETLRKTEPNNSKRAYTKLSYTLGEKSK